MWADGLKGSLGCQVRGGPQVGVVGSYNPSRTVLRSDGWNNAQTQTGYSYSRNLLYYLSVFNYSYCLARLAYMDTSHVPGFQSWVVLG